jgi:type I site-specific restriction-modification system R (restriction) subunit
MLMPEVFIDDTDDADTSFSLTEAVDGDTSFDSIGGCIVSQMHDVCIRRDRREVDLVAKKIINGPQIPLLVVEIKRDNLHLESTMQQIEEYLERVMIRCVALGYSFVYGLLVVGGHSLRVVSSWNSEENEVTHIYWDDVNGEARFVELILKSYTSGY